MIQFQCSCGKVLKVRPEHETRKLQCPACQALIRIRRTGPGQSSSTDDASGTTREKRRSTARAGAASPATQKRQQQAVSVPDDEIEEIEDFDDLEMIEDDFDELDDFAFADEMESDEVEPIDDFESFGAAGMPTKKRRKKKAPDEEEVKKARIAEHNKASAGIPPKLLYAMFGFAGIVLIGVVGLVFSSIKSSSEAYARSQAVPETFSPWTHEKGILSSDYPDGFEVSGGVGAGGAAPWAKFENKDQGVVIMVRASMSGSAISDIAKAQDAGFAAGDLVDPDQMAIDQVKEVHQFQREKMNAEYDTYEELGDRILDCKLGKGCVSEFRGSKVFLKSQGFRATLLGSQFQYNVICKCPADRIEEYKPVFEHVIKSVRG